MKFSVKKETLNTPTPIKLGGFGSRTDYALQIHDPLEIGVLLFESNSNYLAIITLDILGIYNGFNEEIVDRIKRSIDINNMSIVISCAHSHAAPQIGRNENYINQERFIDEICNKSTDLIISAKKELSSGFISFSKLNIDYLGGNRDNPDIARNVYLKALKLKNSNTNGLVININCHPTIMSAENLEISSEYPGAVKRFIDKTTKYTSLFLQGSCGDVSTRFHKKEATFDEVDRLGKMLADDTLKIKDNFTVLDNLKYHEYYLTLNAKHYLQAEEYEKEIRTLESAYSSCCSKEKRIIETTLIGLRKEASISKQINPNTYSFKYGILNINDSFIVFHPFELYSTLEDRLQRNFPNVNIWLVGYCFDCLGYLLDKDSYKDNCYEKYSSIFDELAGEKFIDDITDKLHNIGG